MVVSEQHYQAFKRDLRTYNRRFRRITSSLKGLLDHLYARRQNPARITFDNAIAQCRRPNSEKIYKYRGAIRRLVSVWGTGLAYPNPVAAGPWIQVVKPQLDQQKQFACGDAFFGCKRPAGGGQPPVNWTGFAACINPTQRTQVMNRHDNHTRPFVQGGAAMGGLVVDNAAALDVSWKPANIRSQYNFVYTILQAGICTSFGKASAHVLVSGPRANAAHPRVELVSYKNHVFIIVGRKGGYENFQDYRLPSDRRTWGDDWYIVDGWAGAMGYEVVYTQDQQFPYRSMLNPLHLVMEKEESPG